MKRIILKTGIFLKQPARLQWGYFHWKHSSMPPNNCSCKITTLHCFIEMTSSKMKFNVIHVLTCSLQNGKLLQSLHFQQLLLTHSFTLHGPNIRKYSIDKRKNMNHNNDQIFHFINKNIIMRVENTVCTFQRLLPKFSVNSIENL